MRNIELVTPVMFPNACIACGAPPEKARRLRAIEGFNAIIGRFQRWLSVIIPLCGHCAQRRLFASIVIGPTAVAFGVALTVGAISAADRIDGSLLAFLVVAGITWLILFASRGEQWLDYFFLGVRGMTFSEDGKRIVLRFRDDARARSVESAVLSRNPNGLR